MENHRDDRRHRDLCNFVVCESITEDESRATLAGRDCNLASLSTKFKSRTNVRLFIEKIANTIRTMTFFRKPMSRQQAPDIPRKM
ncbi:MAG TPA: hypothetical protein VI140_02710 [Oxalicibacterium sp.]